MRYKSLSLVWQREPMTFVWVIFANDILTFLHLGHSLMHKFMKMRSKDEKLVFILPKKEMRDWQGSVLNSLMEVDNK